MDMGMVLTRAVCFVAVIVLGYGLRRIGFFRAEDFQVLSKIALKITLPAAIVTSVAGREIDPAMLLISALGLGAGFLYIGLGWLMTRGSEREQQAFEMLNISGYNIGNFTLPFVQSFLGPAGVLTTSLFDTGNAFICLGGAYSAASMVKGGGGFAPRRIAGTLLRSAPFITYVVMITLALLRVKLPAGITAFAELVGNANAFAAMLMIGVGFRLTVDRQQLGQLIRMLLVRYGTAALLALAFFFLLPLPLEYRQALALLAFSPVASANPAFTGELGGDVGLSSEVNSLSIIISVFCILGVLMAVL